MCNMFVCVSVSVCLSVCISVCVLCIRFLINSREVEAAAIDIRDLYLDKDDLLLNPL